MNDVSLPVRVLVVDDEEPARNILRDLLVADPDIDLVGECVNGFEAVEAIREDRPDLVFLDIQMPEMDGFGVLETLRPEELPVVIFVTAFDQYAVQAFEVHALDYLLKPFDDDRFREAVNRAKATLRTREVEKVSERLVRLIRERQDRESRGTDGGLTRLMIRSGGRVRFVRTEDIDWIEAADYYAGFTPVTAPTSCASPCAPSQRDWIQTVSPGSTARPSSTWTGCAKCGHFSRAHTP